MDERRARIHDDLRGVLGGELLFEPIERAALRPRRQPLRDRPARRRRPPDRRRRGRAGPLRRREPDPAPRPGRGHGPGRRDAGAGAGRSTSAGISAGSSRSGPTASWSSRGSCSTCSTPSSPRSGGGSAPTRAAPRPGPIGGMVGPRRRRVRSLRYGTTGDHVERLRSSSPTARPPNSASSPGRRSTTSRPTSRTWSSASSAPIYRRNVDLLARHRPRSPRNRAGYALGDAASPVGIDLARLLVGSEGTLALVTEVTLRTVPIPPAQAVVLLPFGRIGDAAGGGGRLPRVGPSACDLYDWRSISLARDVVPAVRDWIAEAAESALVVEFEGDDPDEVLRRLRGLVRPDRPAGAGSSPTRSRRPAGPTATACSGLRRAVKPLPDADEGAGPAGPVHRRRRRPARGAPRVSSSGSRTSSSSSR